MENGFLTRPGGSRLNLTLKAGLGGLSPPIPVKIEKYLIILDG
jgi:hypothetical protein